VLSQKEFRYIQICTEKITHKKTNEELAEQFGITRTSVDHALKYGKQNGFFNAKAGEVVLEELGILQSEWKYLQKSKRRLERYIKAQEQAAKESGKPIPKPPIYDIERLEKSILEFRTRISELRGIYKKVVNIHQTTEEQNPLYKALCELTETVKGNAQSETD
jgi:hypothetical protein